MSKKIYIKTYGCQMNVYDSTKMLDLLAKSHQMTKTDSTEQADLIILNTCSIREKAHQKLRSDMGIFALLKKDNPDLVIAVGGCVASQEGEALRQAMPTIDIIFGPQTLHRLPQLYDQVIKQRKPVMDISFPEIEKFDCLPPPRAEGPCAFVSIMEGCSKYCSFCCVPYTRGEEISRPFDDLLLEISQLAEQGVREVTLLGQNVNDYRGPQHDGGYADLALLIYTIAAIPGLDRIRFTTSHPLAFSDSLIEAYKEVPQLANHLHLPVQSGSDRILNLMKRGYTALEFKSKIRKLRQVRPDIRISSDFIVGFPGETEQDFQATMDLVRDIGFDHSFSFIYSPRPGTPAASLPDNTPITQKKQRLQQLQSEITTHAQMISRHLVNQVQTILVTGQAKKNSQELTGRTECNRVVNFPGASQYIGQFIDVLITEALPNSLRGRVVAI